MSRPMLPRPEMDPDFRKRLRSTIVNEAVALAEERRLRRPALAQRVGDLLFRLRPALVAAIVVFTLVGGAGVAAAGSLPGDPAYGLKQAAEAIELALAPNADARVEVLASQAQRRLDELQDAASDRPDKAPTASEAYAAAVERLRQAVETMRTAEPEDKRDAVEELVDAAHDKHVQVLETLRERVPEPAQQGIDRALEEQQKIDAGKPDHGRPADPGRSGGAPGRAPASPATETASSSTPTPSPSPTPTPTSDTTATASPRASETPRGGRPSSVPPTRP